MVGFAATKSVSWVSLVSIWIRRPATEKHGPSQPMSSWKTRQVGNSTSGQTLCPLQGIRGWVSESTVEDENANGSTRLYNRDQQSRVKLFHTFPLVVRDAQNILDSSDPENIFESRDSSVGCLVESLEGRSESALIFSVLNSFAVKGEGQQVD